MRCARFGGMGARGGDLLSSPLHAFADQIRIGEGRMFRRQGFPGAFAFGFFFTETRQVFIDRGKAGGGALMAPLQFV